MTAHALTYVVVALGVGLAALYVWRTGPRAARTVTRRAVPPQRPKPRKSNLKLVTDRDRMDRELNELLRQTKPGATDGPASPETR